MLKTYFESIVHWFSSIPDVVWAAIIASFLTIIGVLLTNRSNRLELMIRLRHESDQRDREREMTLRRDVYVPAIEAIFKLPRFLSDFADLDADQGALYKEITNALSSIAKMQLVAKNKTTQTTMAFTSEFGTSYLGLTLKRLALINRKNNIATLQTMIGKVNKEQERWVEELKQLNLTGKSDPVRAGVINSNFEYAQTDYKKYSAEQKSLMDAQITEHLNFGALCFEKSLNLSKLIPELLFSTRDELELEIDRVQYRQQFDESWKTGEKVFGDFIREAEKQLKKQP